MAREDWQAMDYDSGAMPNTTQPSPYLFVFPGQVARELASVLIDRRLPLAIVYLLDAVRNRAHSIAEGWL